MAPPSAMAAVVAQQQGSSRSRLRRDARDRPRSANRRFPADDFFAASPSSTPTRVALRAASEMPPAKLEEAQSRPPSPASGSPPLPQHVSAESRLIGRLQQS